MGFTYSISLVIVFRLLWDLEPAWTSFVKGLVG